MMTVTQRIWLGFCVTVLVIVFVSIHWLMNFNRLQTFWEQEAQGHRITAEMNGLMLDVKRAETAIFAYLISREIRQLETWQIARAELPERTERLRKLLPESAPHRSLLESISRTIDDRMQTFKRMLNATRQQDPHTPFSGVLDTLFQQQSSDLQAFSTEFFAIQNDLLQQMRSDTVQQQAQNSQYVTMGGIIIALALLLMTISTVVSIRRPLRSLINGAARLGDGDLQHRIDITRHDEFGQLALQFNVMAEHIASNALQLSQALKFSETVLHTSPIAMGVYQSNGYCILANEAFAKLVGLS